jgi:hypothetical protein
MSIRVMTAVWDSEAYEGGTLLVLLAMADWAQDDGTKVYPKMETLAAKARLSVRGAQMCVATLKADGVIVEVSASRRGRGTEYQIVLDKVKKLHRNDCTAISSGENTNTVGVQSATVGVQSDVSHIDNHQEPSVEPSNASARLGWAVVWKAFKTWPGLPAGASEQRARQAWERLLPELPEDLAGRIRAFGEDLRRDNERRGRAGLALVVHPHNWLERDRGWETAGQAAAEAVEADSAAAERSEAVRKALGADVCVRLRRAGMREKDISALEGVSFDEGPPARFICPTKATANRLLPYGSALNEIWNGLEIQLAGRRAA